MREQRLAFEEKLGELVQYILMGLKNGPPPTRLGFNAWRKMKGLPPVHHTFFAAAKREGVMRDGAVRSRKGIVITTGERAPEFYKFINFTYRSLLGIKAS